MSKNIRSVTALLACISGLALCGCRGAGVGVLPGGGQHPQGRAIMMDGRFDDWPQNTASLADAHFLYFRVTVEGHGMPLQAAPETVALWLDVDGRTDTGLRLSDPPEADRLGVDLILEFSPPSDTPGQLRRGVAVYAAGPDGQRAALSHAQVDLLAAPTYAAGAYEIRIARHIHPDAPAALREALALRGQGRSMFVVSDAGGAITGWSDPEQFNMPAAAGGPARAQVSLPARPQNAVRILSWNIRDNQPLNNPAPFARVLQAVQPDVVLLQEMWDTDQATILAWFTSVVTGDVEWQARSMPRGEGGVVIVSRYPLSPLGPDRIDLPPEARSAAGRSDDSPVRFIAASVDTPQGQLAIANLHLKCCGTAGSAEDQRRLAEARAINIEMASAMNQGQGGAPMRIIAGDYNLVGTRTPLDVLRAGLDADGSELVPLNTIVLGDAAYYTWFDPASDFSPSRLDWVVAGNASAEVVNAFTLDARRLSDATLAAIGLDRADTAGSDHLPVVVDIRPR
jgi:exonuclease III